MLPHRKRPQSPTPQTLSCPLSPPPSHRNILRPTSPHTPTPTTRPLRGPLLLPPPQTTAAQPLRSPLLLPPPQTPTAAQSSPHLLLLPNRSPTQNSESSPALALTRTDNPDRLAVAIKSSNSVWKHTDAEDRFTSVNGERESQRRNDHKAQAEVR